MKILREKIRNFINFLKQNKKIALVLYFFSLLILLQVILLVINQINSNSPILGLQLEHHSLYFLSQKQIKEAIATEVNRNENNPINIKASSYVGHITSRQLGSHFDRDKIFAHLLTIGRQGNFWDRLFTTDSAFLGRLNQNLGFQDIDIKVAASYLQTIDKKITITAVGAGFDFQNNKVILVKELPGVKIDIEQSLKKVLQFDYRQETSNIDLPLIVTPPPLKVEDIKFLEPKVTAIVANPITLKVMDKLLAIDQKQLIDLLVISKQADSKKPDTLIPTISYSEKKLNGILDDFAKKVDIEPTPQISNGQKIVQKGQVGTRLDGVHAKVDIIATLIRRSEGTENKTLQSRKSPESVKTEVVFLKTEQVEPPKVEQKPTANSSLSQNKATAGADKFPATTSSGGGAVTLTFDDGPNGTYTESILDILKTNKVHAIFFVIGKNVHNYPAITKRIINEGHTIGNHSFTHSDLARLTEEKVNSEIGNTQVELNKTLRLLPNLFRPPYGSMNVTVKKIIALDKLDLMMWSVDPRDWSQPGKDVIVQRVLKSTVAGSNILLHVLYKQTVDALPDIITGLKNRGFTFN